MRITSAILLIIVVLDGKVFSQSDGGDVSSTSSHPNIMSAMTGYNILKGNPFSMNVLHDPGFLASYIFDPFGSSTNTNQPPPVPPIPDSFSSTRSPLHAGVTIRNIRQCDLSMTTDTITNMQEYQRQVTRETSAGLEFASNVEADVQASVNGIGIDTSVPPLVESSFSASSSFRESEQFFANERGVVTINDATCTSYTALISAYNPPPFSDSFLKALNILHRTTLKSDAEKDREFYRFIDNFGTHFLSHATMGARVAITRKYTDKEYAEAKDDAIKDCNMQKLSIFFGQNIGTSLDHCQSIDKSSSSKIKNIYEREYISSYGSKPAKDLVEWSTQDFQNPLPVKMTLKPILNLFGATYMKQTKAKKMKINGKAILNWIAPRYYNFCVKYKHLMGVTTCNAEKTQGCGFNDQCNRRTEHCTNSYSEPKGYTCCSIKQCDKKPCIHGTCYEPAPCSYSCRCQKGYTGKNCQFEILTQVNLQKNVDSIVLRNHQLSHELLSKLVFTDLVKHYNIPFAVCVYDPVMGYGSHNVQGTMFHSTFRHYGHNVVVGYLQTTSPPKSKQLLIQRVTTYLGNHLKYKGCYASQIVDWAKDYLNLHAINFSMIFASPFGNGLRSYINPDFAFHLNYWCSVSTKASIVIMLQ